MFVPSYDLSCICDSTLSFKGRGSRGQGAGGGESSPKLCQTLLNNKHNLHNCGLTSLLSGLSQRSIRHRYLFNPQNCVARELRCGLSNGNFRASIFIHVRALSLSVYLFPSLSVSLWAWLIGAIVRECVNILKYSGNFAGATTCDREIWLVPSWKYFQAVNFDLPAHSSNPEPSPVALALWVGVAAQTSWCC